jgi:hypothetical protein
METKTKPRGLSKQYKVTTICNGQMAEDVMTRQERARLDPNDVDVQIDEPMRELWIKQINRKKSTTHQLGRISGFSVYLWDLLAEIVFSAGEVVQLKSEPYMNQRVRRLRRAFGDSKKDECFFKTNAMPYGIAINTERSWRYIEALAE